MPPLPTPPVPLSYVGRAASDVGLAGLLGGTLYGRIALHPAVAEISAPDERGKVVNAAWRRYGTVNGLSLAAVAVGWVGARSAEASGRRLSPRERRIARLRDGLTAALGVTGVVTAVEGIRFSRTAPGGAVPLLDGDHTTAAATDAQRRGKQRMNALGLATLGVEAALVGVNAVLAQESFRRPPARRMLLGRR